MKPLKDLLVIEMQVEPKEKKNDFGLFIQPPKWAKPTNVGKVLAVGPDISGIAVDSFVLINPYAVLDTEDKQIKLVREKDILCLIEQTNPSPAV